MGGSPVASEVFRPAAAGSPSHAAAGDGSYFSLVPASGSPRHRMHISSPPLAWMQGAGALLPTPRERRSTGDSRSSPRTTPTTPGVHGGGAAPTPPLGGAMRGTALKLPAMKLPSMPVVRTPTSTSTPVPDVPNVKAIDPDTLVGWLRSRDPGFLLVLDIRPRTAYARQHVRGSVNVCAPTALMRRPDFTIERIAQDVVEEGGARARFESWKSATAAPSASHIVVLDLSSSSTSAPSLAAAGGGGASILGLLRKFSAAGFQGELCWLKGGFRTLSARADADAVLEPPVAAEDDAGAASSSMRLPMQRATTLTLPPLHQLSLNGTKVASITSPPRAPGDALFESFKQHLGPQYTEADAVPLAMDLTDPELAKLPRFLRDLARMEDGERARHLVRQFADIQRTESERLRHVLRRHAGDDAADPTYSQVSRRAAWPVEAAVRTPTLEAFPLSISAALERGSHHRYRNFWTYEHGRVKLHSLPPDESYINASYMNPLRFTGGHCLYIATQAPLRTTFAAFWMAVRENRVRVIVMLALEIESGRLQCDNYWDIGSAAPHLDVAVTRVAPRTRADLGLGGAGADADALVFIERTIELRDRSDPSAPPQLVTQIQYVRWPDHGVPTQPLELLALLRRARELGAPPGDEPTPPTLVHCSAGIGRTGTYIVIDALLRLLERVRALRAAPPAAPSPNDELALRAWDGEEDLVHAAVLVLREQRMRMVETVRQYVFIYDAVLAAARASPVP